MRKLAELLQKRSTMMGEVRSLNEEGKIDEAQAKIEEIRQLDKQIEIQKEIDADEEREAQQKMQQKQSEGGAQRMTEGDEKVEARTAFRKAVQGRPLSEEERALVNASTDAEGGYLVPDDIRTEINELKRQYKSAKELVDVVPVGTEGGSFVTEDLSTLSELVNFDEDNTGLPETQPKFRNIEWKVANYGNITPISRTFLQDETAGFMRYLNKFFSKKAIRTENSKIFAELKRGKTAKTITTIQSLKDIVNVQLDPAIKAMSVVATNQSAFNELDKLEDSDGRPLLQPDPSRPTEYVIMGMPVHVFSDAELPNTGDGTAGYKGQMFIGSLDEGVKFFDREVYEVKVSTEAGFTKNQNIARVIERFDVKQNDADAYVYAEIDLP